MGFGTFLFTPGVAGGAPDYRIATFEKAAFMRVSYDFPHPQLVRPGSKETPLLLFVNLTDATQDFYIGAASHSVPRWKSRVVEVPPRPTDMWLKGRERLNYPLEAGVVYRLEIRKYEGGAPAPAPVPEDRLMNITVINRGADSVNLIVNGDRSCPVHIGQGVAKSFPVPGGDVVLSCHAADTPDACYLIAKPQPGFAFDMF